MFSSLKNSRRFPNTGLTLHWSEWKVSSDVRCCEKLPSNTSCRQGWRTVRALGCWLSHLSWLSQQDVTAAPLSVARWPLDLASSPLTCPITASTVSLCSPHSHLNVFAASMRISALVSKRRHKLTISDCGLTSVGSGCWLQLVGFW